MSNFERDMANTMLDAADARIASLEADKADLLRVLSIADEKIRSGEDARGQYIRENAALEARCRFAEGEASLYMRVSVKRSERIATLEDTLRWIKGECMFACGRPDGFDLRKNLGEISHRVSLAINGSEKETTGGGNG